MYNQQSNGIETWVTSLINFIIWTIWYHKLLLHMLTAKIINIRPRWSQIYPHLASDMHDYSGIILTRLRLNDLITLRLIADKSRKRRREFWISIWLNQAQIQHCINPLIAQKSKKPKKENKEHKILNLNLAQFQWSINPLIVQNSKKKEKRNEEHKILKATVRLSRFPKKEREKILPTRLRFHNPLTKTNLNAKFNAV